MTEGFDTKIALITGATSGIGEATARGLAVQGLRVVIVGRNEAKCRDVIEEITTQTGNQNLHYIVADLSSIAATRAAAAEFQARFDRLDLLINNAGGLFQARRTSIDGYELHLALNHLSVFVLTNALLPLLHTAADNHPDFGARIITVSSDSHRNGVQWDDLQGERSYAMMRYYGQSKAMNIMFTKEVARRFAGTNVTANVLHPGVVQTAIFAKGLHPLQSRLLGLLGRLFFKTPEQGAATSIYLATDPAVCQLSGEYFINQRIAKPNQCVLDPADWQRLWQQSEAWVAR